MRIESGPGGYHEIERVELPYADESIEAFMGDKEAERTLYESDPVTWLRGSMTVDTERGASEVTDQELARKLVNGGFAEWDPTVATAVKARLDTVGIQYII